MDNPSININWVPGITLEEMEKQCILAAFRFYRGNKTTTSQVLGIAIRTLDNKLEKYSADAAKEQERKTHEQNKRASILARMRGQPYSEPHEQHNSALPEPTTEGEASGVDAVTGLREKPVAKPSKKPAVSVSKRKEVQRMLPRKTGTSGVRRSR